MVVLLWMIVVWEPFVTCKVGLVYRGLLGYTFTVVRGLDVLGLVYELERDVLGDV